MQYPIIQVKTPDGLGLYGLFFEAEGSKTIFLHTHGTSSNFYEEDFIEVLSKELIKNNISILSANNRGAGVYDAFQKSGAATEKFEDCLIDLDTWIELLLSKGYENIILSGHSLGTEKVVYYTNKGKFKNKIKAIVLLAPSDSSGFSWIDKTKTDSLMKESLDLIERKKGETFLARDAYSGIMPKSAESFVNFLGPASEISKALSFSLGKLKMYSEIRVPILVLIGDEREYTVLPIKESLELMKKENPNTETHQLQNCDHDFQGKEKELSRLVIDFIKRIWVIMNL